jgi:hypothetical protein
MEGIPGNEPIKMNVQINNAHLVTLSGHPGSLEAVILTNLQVIQELLQQVLKELSLHR